MKKKALMPISALMVALLLALVAAMIPFVGEHEVAHAQQITGPTLATLGVTVSVTTETHTSWGAGSSVPLSPKVPDKLDEEKSYTARVPNGVSQVTVSPTVESPNIYTTDTITPADANTGEPNHQVNLSVGTTTISIPVTTAGGASNTYIVRVTRVPSAASSDANLSSLNLSNVTLSFDHGKTMYTDRVPSTVLLTTVTARAADSGATVSIKHGTSATITMASFDTAMAALDSVNVPLDAAGTTYIGIMVTAANLTSAKTLHRGCD